MIDKRFILRELKKFKNFRSDADFSRFLDITPQNLSKWYERNTFDVDKIVNKFPEINTVWLLTGEGERLKADTTVSKIKSEGLPLIPFEYMAGFGEDNAGIRLNECEHYLIPEFENIGAEFLVRVGGSSMYPKYSSGDILACKKIPREDITFFQWGKVYVIDSAQGQLIKRVFEHEDGERIMLVSDNAEKYKPFPIQKSDIRILSIVLGVLRME